MHSTGGGIAALTEACTARFRVASFTARVELMVFLHRAGLRGAQAYCETFCLGVSVRVFPEEMNI